MSDGREEGELHFYHHKLRVNIMLHYLWNGQVYELIWSLGLYRINWLGVDIRMLWDTHNMCTSAIWFQHLKGCRKMNILDYITPGSVHRSCSYWSGWTSATIQLCRQIIVHWGRHARWAISWWFWAGVRVLWTVPRSWVRTHLLV